MIFARHMNSQRLVALAVSLCAACATPAAERMPTVAAVSAPEARPAPSNFTLAFGSCAHQDRPQPVLDAAIAAEPDVFVYLGDNIYGDTEDRATLEATYARLAERPEFQRLRAAVPIVATWDDHDYGKNDGGREYPMREASEAVFLDFWQVPPEGPQRQHPGVYGAFTYGEGDRRVQLLVLDTRSFRGPLAPAGDDPRFKHRYRPDPSAVLLGDAQWAWLEARLEEPAALRIIASSIQFSGDYTGFESWANLPRERARLVALLGQSGPSPVLFLSGDVHHGELSRLTPSGQPPIYDLTSSGINQVGTILEPSNTRLGEAVFEPNFGLLSVDWRHREVHLELRGEEAQTLFEHCLTFDELTQAP
ncbi:MAG: alkaline phosphatase D family protein [Myxococcota bacterium]